MTRADKLHTALEAAEKHGAIRGHYCYAPGDRGRVWVIEAGHGVEGASMVGTLSLTTKQAEAFISGLEVAR